MAVEFRRPRNANDTAITPADISVGTTATTLLSANADRLHCIISNTSNKHIRLKFQAAVTDDLIEGPLVLSGTSWEMPTDNVYIGEISAILDSGAGTADIGVVEW